MSQQTKREPVAVAVPAFGPARPAEAPAPKRAARKQPADMVKLSCLVDRAVKDKFVAVMTATGRDAGQWFQRHMEAEIARFAGAADQKSPPGSAQTA